MKKIPQKNDRARRRAATPPGLDVLGGLSAKKFLRHYWQKKPLLIRAAFPHFADPLSKQEVWELARREEAESRLVIQSGNVWELRHGPFRARDFAALKKSSSRWTVLVQDTQHFSHEAHDVLAKFAFIPHARVDDLMVSYAVPGGGVGAHVDSYDVFLLQGTGRRRWQISAQRDLRLREGVPLKILSHFKAEQEFVLDSGDMLYLPPGYAHHGVAESECLTWSIGFRAPSQQELSTALLDFLRDEIHLPGLYRDPDLQPARHPGEIDAGMLRRARGMVAPARRMAGDEQAFQRFLGAYLTEPKSHVYFDEPEPLLAPSAFTKAASRHGIALDLKSRLLFIGKRFFLNGSEWPGGEQHASMARQLADHRRLSGSALAAAQGSGLTESLYAAYRDGYVQLQQAQVTR